MEKKRIELLAPAGSFESMKAAVAAGADAVYMGGTRFGARAYADNPDQDRLLEAIDYVHLHGCRLYMTVNTLFKERELEELYDYMLPYYRRGLDGVIVQDLGALSFMKEHFPGMELHGSTQMTITSLYGAELFRDMGCCRVVTARELSLEEIRRIRDEVGVEIESFVHGALCYCYSGQCLMSSLIGGRSGNRGRCAQPCRLPYTVLDKGGDSKQGSSGYVLSLKDLCTLDILPDIVESGVYSLKIEGRMKSPRYTAGVVSIYRKYVDRYLSWGREGYYVEPEDRKQLLELFDRGGFTSGYYTQHNGRDMIAIKEKPEFRQGNQELFDYLDQTYVEAELKEKAEGWALCAEGEPVSLRLRCRGAEVFAEGQVVQRAQNQPMTAEKVEKQLKKTGGTPFSLEKLSVEVKGQGFLPVQALNELRRNAFDALYEELLKPFRRPEPEGEKAEPENMAAEPETGSMAADTCSEPVSSGLEGDRGLWAALEEEDQLKPALESEGVAGIYIDAEGFGPESWEQTVQSCRRAGKQCWLMLPQIFRTHAMRYFKKNREKLEKAAFDGFLVRTLEEIEWLRQQEGPLAQLPVILDASVYAWNSRTVSVLKETGAAAVTMPWELNSRELVPVVKACRKEGLGSELIVYGHAPMMVSAQCITRTVKGCTGKRGTLVLKDRTGARLPVKNRCAFCYNTIFNPVPVSLLGNASEAAGLGAGRIRLSFTVETEDEVRQILKSYSRVFVNGEEPEGEEGSARAFTRGHFKRGVE